MPAVSVVITCFNLESYVGEAIDSALVALNSVDGEIVVVDDCSTDGSADVIRRYPQVRYLRTERNGGVMRATLAGIAASRHPIIAFLDGDDRWRADKLERVRAAFAADDTLAFLTHDLDFIDGEGHPIARRSRPGETMVGDPARWSDHLRRSIAEHRDDVWLGSAMSIHRDRGHISDFAEWVRRRSDADQLYQDWPMAAWIAAQPGITLGYLPETLFSYRLHGANHSGDSAGAARALRNFTRTRNSLAAMVAIADMRAKASAKLRRDLALAEAQVALYKGRRWDAIRHFAAALPQLAKRPTMLAKESFRLGALTVMGPERGQRMLKRIAD